MYGNDTTALGAALPCAGAAVAGNITLALVILFAGLAVLTVLAVAKHRRK